MWKKPKPAEQELSPSDTKDSEQNSAPEDTQLSDDDGVESDVSSVALSRGLLAVGMQAPAAEGGLSDAEMMLRVSGVSGVWTEMISACLKSSDNGIMVMPIFWARSSAR